MDVEVRRVEGSTFVAKGPSNHWVVMDARPEYHGQDAGARPVELLLMSLGGCSGVDVELILRKMRVDVRDFRIQISGEQREKQPQGTVTIDKQVNPETLNPETTPKGEEVVLPFDSENFKAQWQLWKAYKKRQHRFTYKHEASEQAALTSLSNMATGQERKAIAILHYTMANGWKGFVAPKDEGTSTKMTVEDILNGVN